MIAALFNVDLDWLTGQSNTRTPYSGIPLAMTAGAPKSKEPIAKLRSAALSRLLYMVATFLAVGLLACLIITGAVYGSVSGTFDFWVELVLIVASLALVTSFLFTARLLYRSIRTALTPARELDTMIQAGLRLHLAEKLYEYLAEDPLLTSGEITGILHGSFRIDDDLVARLCTEQTRSRKELVHIAFFDAEQCRALY